MEQMSISTSVKVKGGPSWRVDADFEADVYAVASVVLGDATPQEVTVMPDGATAYFVVIKAVKDTDGKPARIKVTPKGSGTEGDELEVAGSMVATNASALAGLADGGTQHLTLESEETESVTVSVLVAFGS